MGNSTRISDTQGYCNRMQRIGLLIATIAIMSLQTGCQVFDRFRLNRPSAPVAFTNVPTQNELLAHFKTQAEKIKQLKSNVQVSMAGIPTKIRGTLSVELPRRFRLEAGVMGVSELGIDVGSNDEQFWIWSKASLPNEQPALYYASHDAFERSAARKAIPIKPEWLIDALGLLSPQPGDRYTGPTMQPDGRLQLDTYRPTASGMSIRRSSINAKTGLIEQQSIYDANGKRVAYVNSTNHKLDVETGVSLPHRIVLHVDQPNGQTLKLTLNANEFKVNALYGDPNQLWAMPTPAEDPMIDITKLQPPQATPGLNRVGQQNPRFNNQ